jgi:hypothetical protein
VAVLLLVKKSSETRLPFLHAFSVKYFKNRNYGKSLNGIRLSFCFVDGRITDSNAFEVMYMFET